MKWEVFFFSFCRVLVVSLSFVGFDACFNLFYHFQIKTWNAAG